MVSPVRVTVKVAVPAPSFTVTSLMLKAGRSSSLPPPPVPSSRIVPTPWLSAITALTALDRFTKNCSLPSNTLSFKMLIGRLTVMLPTPAAKFRVPLADV